MQVIFKCIDQDVLNKYTNENTTVAEIPVVRIIIVFPVLRRPPKGPLWLRWMSTSI